MISDLGIFERHVYSQQGEDGIIEAITTELGIREEGFFVEIGVQNGRECNCRYLIESKGWSGIMIDNDPKYFINILHRYKGSLFNVQNKHITAENVISVLSNDFGLKSDQIDLLSLDIDGVDYWVLKSIISKYSPKVLVCEYNSQLGYEQSISIEYKQDFRWTGNYYQGASLMAFVKLLTNYTLVYCENNGVNCFFVRNDLIEGHFTKKEPKELFKKCNFACGPKFGNEEGVCGHQTKLKDGQEWVIV